MKFSWILFVATLALYMAHSVHGKCQSDDDCHGGRKCFQGRCSFDETGSKSCKSTDECGPKYFCSSVSGKCLLAREDGTECVGEYCDGGQACENGYCVRLGNARK